MLTPAMIAAMLDHSTLQPFLTDEEIVRGCEIAKKYHTASVCARPGDMALVAEALRGTGIAPCTVIGFPHGAHLTAVKAFEAERALDAGCTELDMVIAVGRLKSGAYDFVREDIAAVVKVAHERGARVKVILETCYLTDEEKRVACGLCAQAQADFVKTSTGYGSAGATVEDVRLMRAAVPERMLVKASGGIRTLDAVLALRAAGAARMGVSATEAILGEAERRFAEGALPEA